MLTNDRIMQIALEQSAIDSGCAPSDFLAPEHKIVLSRPHQAARRYLQLPFDCDLTSYGDHVVASVSPEVKDAVADYLSGCDAALCFETPRLHLLEEALSPFGLSVCFMAEYFLPDTRQLRQLTCGYETCLLETEELANLDHALWHNALSTERPQLDRLAVGAYDRGELVGLAGASADCDTMWQIGIDVLPAYRRQGIASALVAQLALAVLSRDLVPFYCCAWSNIRSARTAIRAGFRPAWVTITAKKKEFVTQMYDRTRL